MKDYQKKIEGCKRLVKKETKKVRSGSIAEVAKELDIDYLKMQRAWDNFQATGGTVDLRRKTGNYVGKETFGANAMKPLYFKRVTVDFATAGKIIKEYMNTKIKVIELCNKYQLSPVQFYSWLKELNTSGTLLGKTVLNPKKYAKLNVLDVIYLRRYPKTTKKEFAGMTELQKCAYERVAVVLENYLS